MKTSTATILTAALFAVLPFMACAESDGILANTGHFRPKISISNTYADRLETDGAAAFNDNVSAREKVAVTVVANVEGIDPRNLSPATDVVLEVGGLVIARKLGDDPAYVVGRTRAVFPLVTNVERPGGGTAVKLLGRLACAWDHRRLTLTLTCTDLDAAGLSSILAREFAGAAATGTRVKVGPEPIEVLVTFGSLSGCRTAYLSGVSRTQLRRFRTADREAYADMTFAKVTLAGAADVTSPRVNGVFPVTSDALGRIAVGGFGSDPNGLCLKSLTVNGGEPFPPIATFGEPNARGIRTWRIEELYLQTGLNEVIVTLCDADGNERSLSKRLWVKVQQWD